MICKYFLSYFWDINTAVVQKLEHISFYKHKYKYKKTKINTKKHKYSIASSIDPNDHYLIIDINSFQ